MAEKSSADIFDPVDYYLNQVSKTFHQKTSDFFDQKLKASGVNEKENEVAYKKLRVLEEKANQTKKKKNGLKVWRGVLIFLLVVAFIVGVLGSLLCYSEYSLPSLLCAIFGFVIGVALLLVILFVLNPKIKDATSEASKAQKAYLNQASIIRASLAPLYNSFHWDDFKKIVKETTDMFTVDETLPEGKMLMLHDVYQYTDILDKTDSVITLMSGNIQKNPYIRMMVKGARIVDITYTGTLTISWTERVYDSDGHFHTTVRTQLLTATYVEPGPAFTSTPMTIYGNLAAPDLFFSRNPCGINTKDEKDVASFVEKEQKKIQSYAEEATKKGKVFTPLSNNEFEALFGAYDRDHEVQFRLLFTPLAQQNMLEIIKGKAGYGDDFLMKKCKTITLVQSRHSENIFHYDSTFVGDFLSVKEMRNAYLSYMDSLFMSLYFDLAPLMAIPLYQMTDAGEYTPQAQRRSISDYEAMRAVNHMPGKLFQHPEGDTDQILRVSYLNTQQSSDRFEVQSLSYRKIPRTTFVPTLGGDGRMHNVPVAYFEYQPVTAVHEVGIRYMNETKEKWDQEKLSAFLSSHHGSYVENYAAYLVASGADDNGEKELDSLIDHLDDVIEEKMEHLDEEIEGKMEALEDLEKGKEKEK